MDSAVPIVHTSGRCSIPRLRRPDFLCHLQFGSRSQEALSNPAHFALQQPSDTLSPVASAARASGGMADALASGASTRKGVGVQVPSRAQHGRPSGRPSAFSAEDV